MQPNIMVVIVPSPHFLYACFFFVSAIARGNIQMLLAALGKQTLSVLTCVCRFFIVLLYLSSFVFVVVFFFFAE